MRIIAIDPSIRECGYCVYDTYDPIKDNKNTVITKVISSGVIKPKGDDYTERLYDLRYKLQGIIETYYFREGGIEEAVIEAPKSFAYARHTNKFTGKSMVGDALLILSRAIGVIQVTFAEYGVPVTEITPEWKGRMNKEWAKTITKKTNHNEADAILLAMSFSGFYTKCRKRIKKCPS